VGDAEYSVIKYEDIVCWDEGKMCTSEDFDIFPIVKIKGTKSSSKFVGILGLMPNSTTSLLTALNKEHTELNKTLGIFITDSSNAPKYES
jgi:hypothetical protein